MTEQEIRATYPEVDAFYEIIESKSIALVVLPDTDELKAISFREISFKSSMYSCVIPVDDEYEDAQFGNSALLVQLIIFSLEEYENCDDFLIWSATVGLNASDPLALDLYQRTGEIVPKIRAIIGNDVHGISDLDWQLNAGAAQALRKLKQ